jgi:hypothetical protein
VSLPLSDRQNTDTAYTKNMGRYKSLSDAGYGALATILKTFVIADQSNSLEASSPGS